MKRIGILGDIGSGKSYVAREFGHPVFNADIEVSKLYKKDRKIFHNLNKILPKFITKFPIDKNEVSKAILDNKHNLKKIVKIVHKKIRKKMNDFLKNNRKRKIVVLDVPLLLENKLNKKKDISKKLKKRKNFNQNLLKKFKIIQLPLDYKKRKSQFVIKNDFKKKSVKKYVKHILDNI